MDNLNIADRISKSKMTGPTWNKNKQSTRVMYHTPKYTERRNKTIRRVITTEIANK